MEDVEAAFYEAWEDAGLADEAAPRAKGSRPSSQNKRKVRHQSADTTRRVFLQHVTASGAATDVDSPCFAELPVLRPLLALPHVGHLHSELCLPLRRGLLSGAPAEMSLYSTGGRYQRQEGSKES